ncbi:arabinose efflux permease family protein [Actinobacteria bacterium IMCC26207]|nr:arabinose efflux permease family protein [Actinobacteria bacterium IMCC26207]
MIPAQVELPDRSLRGLPVIAAASVAAILPAFFLGSLSVEIRSELGYGEAAAGLVFASFFAASAVGSSRVGGWVDRVGPKIGLSTALLGACLVNLAIALGARHLAALIALSAIAGICNATAQLGANVYIARNLPIRRQGIGFAVKQSAIPGAALIAGILLPSVALTLGWRWVFAIGSALGVAALIAVRVRVQSDLQSAHNREHLVHRDTLRGPRGALVMLAVAAAFATAAAITLGGFFVESTINSGVSPATAGYALALGSLISILVRLLVGGYADRQTGNLLGVVAIMILLGSCTSLIFVAQTPTAHFIGLPLAFGAGWAWPGLFNLSVIRASPGFPGRATGITQTGVYIGGAVGPVLFGFTAEHWSYSAAWVLAAVLGVCAAGAVTLGQRLLVGSGSRTGNDLEAVDRTHEVGT